MRQRTRPERQRAEPAPAAARDGSASRVLDLQRSAGNAAVSRLVAERLLQRDGWPEARKGGWNEKARDVTGTLRIPIKGLKSGVKDKDRNDNTSEFSGDSSGGRAIVVVPDGIDFTAKLEVLLLFHGLGASAGIGYRERTSKDDMGDVGTVHDVEADLIEQQLGVSKRNMIAILAQGRATGKSRWDIPDPQAYVDDVLAQLKTEMAKLRPDVKLPDTLSAYRIVSAGHSGGGPQAVASADALQTGDWHRRAPLLLFDAINGPNELKNLRTMLTAWLEEDKRHLLAAKDPAAELAKRGLKFRSTYSVDSDEVYKKNHEGGKYTLESGGKTIKVDISHDESLNGFLDNWFRDNATGALAKVAATWQAQYVTERSSGSHHHQIGARAAAGPKERDKAGVPIYTPGTGNLEKGLQGLPGDALRPKRPAHALLETLDPDEVLV